MPKATTLYWHRKGVSVILYLINLLNFLRSMPHHIMKVNPLITIQDAFTAYTNILDTDKKKKEKKLFLKKIS